MYDYIRSAESLIITHYKVVVANKFEFQRLIGRNNNVFFILVEHTGKLTDAHRPEFLKKCISKYVLSVNRIKIIYYVYTYNKLDKRSYFINAN